MTEFKDDIIPEENKDEAFEEIVGEVMEEVVEDLTWWQSIKYLFIQPSKTMKYLARKPKVLFPVLLMIISLTAFSFVKMDLLLEFTKQMMVLQMEKMGVPPLAEVPQDFLKFALWSAMGGTVATPLFLWFGKGAVIHLLAKIFKGTGQFKGALSVVAYSYFILLLGEAIRTIIALLTKNYFVLTSLALFLPESDMGKPLFTLLGSLDVFSIWYLTVLTIGLSYTHKLEAKKSGIIVFGSWAMMIVISVLLTLVNR